MNIKVAFYDYYGQLNSDQTISVQDELASLNMSLSELESYGVIAPVLNDITIMNKTYFFTKFVYHLSKIESTYYRYIFWAKYVEEDLLLPHYNDKVDKVEYYVDRLGVDIKSFIDSDNNTINELKNKVQNWDGYVDLAEELRLIGAVNATNEQKVLLLNSGDLDERIDNLSTNITMLEDSINYDYEEDIVRISDGFEILENNKTKIDYIDTRISNRVKHVFLTNAEYGSLPVKDMDTLYFTT